MPTLSSNQAPVPPPAYHRAQDKAGSALASGCAHAQYRLASAPLCRLTVRSPDRRLPAARQPVRVDGHAAIGRSRSCCWRCCAARRLSYQDLHDWLVTWPALAWACGLPADATAGPGCPAPPSNAAGRRRLARRCARRCSWSWCNWRFSST